MKNIYANLGRKNRECISLNYERKKNMCWHKCIFDRGGRVNILILSAGTRCQLVKYFKQKTNGFDKVVTTDCSIYAPAIYMSDIYYIVPKAVESNYLSVILGICKKENIHMILPLQEDELELIASNKEIFEKEGILAAVSDIETVRTCRDKLMLYQQLVGNGISCIETYDYNTMQDVINHMKFPVIAKKRMGAGSIGNLKIKSFPLLFYYAEDVQEKLVVQPYIDAQEYGADVYVDFLSGEMTAVFVKEKIRMRAGETEKSKSVKDEALFDFIKKIVQTVNLRGAADIDLFKYDGKYHVLEINPRFGGGYPHAYACGVNFIRCLSRNAGRKRSIPEIGQYDENEVMLKYTDAMMKSEKEMLIMQNRIIL